MGNILSKPRPRSPPTDLTGKIEHIDMRDADFLKKEGAEEDRYAFKNRVKGHQYQKHGKNWIQESTYFSDALNNDEVHKLGSGENIFFVSNRESFSKAQYVGKEQSCGMSAVHILAFSVENYFNPVSMTPDELEIIPETIELFKTYWDSHDFREKVLKQDKVAIKNRGGKGRRQALRQWKKIRRIIHTLKFEDFRFGLHLYPDNSIPHFHMHIIAATEECRQYSPRVNDAKTVDALEYYNRRKHRP
ncbi:hypothetical protein ABKA04_005952 [Annulohypoxylon sp. FPYF3050]